MFKVLAITDKADTAIDRLANGVTRYLNGYAYAVLPIHPKRPDLEDLVRFEALAQDADVIDYHYFRTAEMLRSKFPYLKEKKSILRHFNPYSIHDGDWSEYDVIVACNKSIESDLRTKYGDKVIMHPITRNPDDWQYNNDWRPSNKVLMVANRIEAKKGIKEVAQACANENLEFHIIGNISDHAYFQELMQIGNISFSQNVTDEELMKIYHRSALLVCNSIDNFESGTMPIQEAMFCGTPVLTRLVGHVPDLYNGENMIINPNAHDDVEALTKLLHDNLADIKNLQTMRERAWQTIKSYTDQRRAWLYRKLYRKLQGDHSPVSVILPTAGNIPVLMQCMEAIVHQTYDNIEIVVCDDGGDAKEAVKTFSSLVNIPVQYHNTSQGDYGLARARNVGIINATGDVLVFCDQRQIMEKEAVAEFVKNLVPRKWLYGDKGVKKEFVENFSCIYRDDIVRLGMFNERVNLYGGQSQEVRARSRAQGITHEYIGTAKAKPAKKSSNKYNKRNEIIAMKDLLYMVGL